MLRKMRKRNINSVFGHIEIEEGGKERQKEGMVKMLRKMRKRNILFPFLGKDRE
jgi:hypothetical protein